MSIPIPWKSTENSEGGGGGGGMFLHCKLEFPGCRGFKANPTMGSMGQHIHT